jgi:hypothetical protein
MMRAEGDALLGNFAQLGQRHHLKAAAIGEDRAVPLHEFVQTAQRGNPLGGGAQHQVIGIAQHNLGAGGLDRFTGHRLDGGGSANRHEGGRFGRAMRGVQPAPAGAARGFYQIK